MYSALTPDSILHKGPQKLTSIRPPVRPPIARAVVDVGCHMVWSGKEEEEAAAAAGLEEGACDAFGDTEGGAQIFIRSTVLSTNNGTNRQA